MVLSTMQLLSMFTGVLSMNNQDWLQHLQMLIQRFSYLGLDADIASLGLIELWGLYIHLSQLARD